MGVRFLSGDWVPLQRQDGRRTVKWVIEIEGGSLFPANAAAACGLAVTGAPVGDLADVFMRLGTALASAKTSDPMPEDAEGPWPDFDPGRDG
jgi:hypothetical protein